MAAFFPKVYIELKVIFDKLCDHHQYLRRNFPAHSVYPAAAVNLGPSAVTRKHRDPGNVPRLPCAIQSFGDYDPDLGGHLILYDLKLIVRFPPGSLILISSASIEHGNTPIQPGETRYSFVQFCPGALYRWVRHGFRPAGSLTKQDRARLDGDPHQRWKEGLAMLSTPKSLQSDRRYVVNRERSWQKERDKLRHRHE